MRPAAVISDSCPTMIELLPLFLVLFAVSLVVLGTLLGGVLKFVLLRFAMPLKDYPPVKSTILVIAAEILIMTVSIFVAFLSVGAYAYPKGIGKDSFVALLLVAATALYLVLAVPPNALLLRPLIHDRVRTDLYRIFGRALLLSLTAPLGVSVFAVIALWYFVP
jgi:hypothetical protein